MQHSGNGVFASRRVFALAWIAGLVGCTSATTTLRDASAPDAAFDGGPPAVSSIDAGPPCSITGCPGPICPNAAPEPCWTCDDAGLCHAPPDAGGLPRGSACKSDHDCAPIGFGPAYCLYWAQDAQWTESVVGAFR